MHYVFSGCLKTLGHARTFMELRAKSDCCILWCLSASCPSHCWPLLHFQAELAPVQQQCKTIYLLWHKLKTLTHQTCDSQQYGPQSRWLQDMGIVQEHFYQKHWGMSNIVISCSYEQIDICCISQLGWEHLTGQVNYYYEDILLQIL